VGIPFSHLANRADKRTDGKVVALLYALYCRIGPYKININSSIRE